MNIPNPDLELAEEYIHDTGSNIFLTGKAGTGKTTFLHTLKQSCSKRLVVTAPTGVAAINAGGVTLHSFFQLPFGPFLPGSQNSRGHFRFSKEKQGIIKCLDLLVIDEVSMVRADLLDGVDNVLRRLRRSSLPFGGVQLLMIGDLHQLPPVVKNDEWRLLCNHYASPFFFSSNALASTEMVTIELKKIYRQQDSSFIDILNQVRNNSLDSSSLAALNSRAIADFSAENEAGCITLCTHNRSADVINRTMLDELPGKPRTFAAEVEGEFPDHTYPAAEALTLKKDAQVMFIRNDLSAEKRYFNGKIGTITSVSPSTIRVKCPDDHEEIEVEPATWENIEYSLNKETQEITEKIIGTFNQHPLRLAWAITIHKSQGLTFDKAMIDAQAAFAHGQVYVALSRCRTLEGMVLSSPLSPKVMNIDQAVLRFADEAGSNPPPADLRTAKISYQQRLILECFDFGRLRSLLRRMTSLILGNRGSVQVSGISDIAELQQITEEAVFTVGGNFQRQLRTLFNESVLPAEDHIIHERLTKASAYFQEKITLLSSPVNSLQVDTDSKELRKKTRNTLQLLEEEIGVKLAAVSCCKDGFDAARYFRAISAAALDAQKKPTKKEQSAVPAYTESDISHPELFQILKEWRSSKAGEEGVANFQVLHQKTLIQIAVNLPESLPALKKIKGIGTKLAEKYGEELVGMVGRYRSEHNIEEVELPRLLQVETKSSTPKKKVVDTRKLTLELFENGLTPLQIAVQRELTLSTIENHIAHLIEEGEIAAQPALISAERLEELQDPIAAMSEKPLKEIKQKLTVDATYGEIRFVQAHLRNLASSTP